jgi:IS1 family transposase
MDRMSFFDIESNKKWTWSGEQLRQYGINKYFPERTKKQAKTPKQLRQATSSTELCFKKEGF